MTVFAAELICQLVTEIQPLLQDHYQELTHRKDVVKLDPDWAAYTLLEQLGRFHAFTVRDAGELVGYSAYFLQPHIHYRSLVIAQNDVFWLQPGHRRGTTALRFLRYCEAHLKQQGAQKLVYHCKASNNFAPILRRMGFKDEEVMVGKIL